MKRIFIEVQYLDDRPVESREVHSARTDLEWLHLTELDGVKHRIPLNVVHSWTIDERVGKGWSDYLPDWLRCLNCKVNAKNGKIDHLKTCPDYLRK
jgi:hypothetical protein